MSGKNCPNCGAPYDTDKDKCPFCGTIYYDMSAIDFDSGKPIFLKFRINGMTVTQKCIPKVGSITICRDTTDCMSQGRKLYSVSSNVNIETEISFTAVQSCDESGELIKVTVPEGFCGKSPLNYSEKEG